ncbi:MAG: radical SAM protein [Deltaproteobacteria bacterium]|jgi:radical SAM protein with 4Fe4S-binding SPASM domain|nr:radical SAM protein [Deltaproteobacteria bacterium]
MIGISKLYCGAVEPSDLLRYGGRSQNLPSHLLQFSTDKKPVIAWNVTRACNLSCLHCYASATAGPAPDELSLAEARALVESLAAFGVPVILFSGGEPLLHPHIFELISLAVSRGLRAVLSTNGLLITPDVASRLKDIGLSYVGVSLDGLAAHHDWMRRKPGAFGKTMEGISTCLSKGLKVGLRLTIARSNQNDIGGLFDLMAERDIPRACFYHLVDTGQNPALAQEALTLAETRQAVDLIAARTLALFQKGQRPEVLTVDNQADGPYIYLKLRAEGNLERAEKALELLKLNGGSSSGLGVGCVSWNGDVFPDQFWRSLKLGSTREKPFPAIWTDPRDEFLMALKNKKDHLTGRCRECRFLDACGGGLRARAAQATGDVWAPDPACYLTDEETRLPSPLYAAAERNAAS